MRRNKRRAEREIATIQAEERAAAQRVCVMLGICPECFDDLPIKGSHVCWEDTHGE
jgi:hypothetical protein